MDICVRGGVDVAEVAVAERGGEVLFVAEQHVDLLHEPAVRLGGGLGPAARVPQRRAVVEIEGDDGAVPPGRGHRLDRERGGARRERGEDAAAMEPASPVATEDGVPVEGLAGIPVARPGPLVPGEHASGNRHAELGLAHFRP